MLNVIQKSTAPSLSEKYLLGLADGSTVEAMHLNVNYLSPSTVYCLSTQVGCPFDCKFCSSGETPFARNLTLGEMGEQLETVKGGNTGNYRVALMGVGEPLSNYGTVVEFINRLGTPLNERCKRISLSTIGIPARIRKLSGDLDKNIEFNLQVSIHASNDLLRRQLLPHGSRYTLESIVDACASFVASTKHRLFVSYVLVDGVNDHCDHAHELAALLSPLREKLTLKLARLNGFVGCASYKPASGSRADLFAKVVKQAQFRCEEFSSVGQSVTGGCGQLRAVAGR